MRRLLPLSITALLLIFASAARAQGPPEPPTTTPAPPPPPPPAAMKIQAELQRVGHASEAVAFVGKAVRVRGVVTPYVAGQKVHVRFHRGSSIARSLYVKISASRSGSSGSFVVDYKPKALGRLRVDVTHDATPQASYAHAAAGKLEVIRWHATLGSGGRTVLVMQRLLRASGYVPGRPGLYDARTGRAVLAFRKMSGLARVESAPYAVLRRIVAGGGRFKVRFPHQGRHAEGDLTHQVLALINGTKVERLYPISSGKPSTPTVLGTFRIYQRTPGYLPDGMYYSSFFTGGYAIHGYDPSPVYPASHGCMRTPIPDAVSIYNWLAMGDYVDTYYRTPGHRHVKPSKNAGP